MAKKSGKSKKAKKSGSRSSKRKDPKRVKAAKKAAATRARKHAARVAAGKKGARARKGKKGSKSKAKRGKSKKSKAKSKPRKSTKGKKGRKSGKKGKSRARAKTSVRKAGTNHSTNVKVDIKASAAEARRPSRSGKKGGRKGGHSHRAKEHYPMENPVSWGEGILGFATGTLGFLVEDGADRAWASHALTAKGDGTFADTPPTTGSYTGLFNATAILAPMDWKRWLSGGILTALPFGIAYFIPSPLVRSGFQFFGFGVGIRFLGKAAIDGIAFLTKSMGFTQRLYDGEMRAAALRRGDGSEAQLPSAGLGKPRCGHKECVGLAGCCKATATGGGQPASTNGNAQPPASTQGGQPTTIQPNPPAVTQGQPPPPPPPVVPGPTMPPALVRAGGPGAVFSGSSGAAQGIRGVPRGGAGNKYDWGNAA